MTDVVKYQQGRAVVDVRRDPLDAGVEIWRGPRQELRARLRDEIKIGRVQGEAYGMELPGLPRGWMAMRVQLVAAEQVRERKLKRWRRAGLLLAGVAAVAGGVYFLVSWVVAQLAMLVAGATVGAGVGAGIVAALLLLAAGGTSTVVVVKVIVKH
jgi:hypothetical protein